MVVYKLRWAQGLEGLGIPMIDLRLSSFAPPPYFSCPEDCEYEETAAAPGILQISAKHTQPLSSLHPGKWKPLGSTAASWGVNGKGALRDQLTGHLPEQVPSAVQCLSQASSTGQLLFIASGYGFWQRKLGGTSQHPLQYCTSTIFGGVLQSYNLVPL